MAIPKIIIKNGIVQNKEIDGIPVKVDIVSPRGKRNVRTLKSLRKILGITNHNTANTHPNAGDEMHAKWMQNVENASKQYVGAHFFVDHDSITQVLPTNEVGYNAGDGSGNGNYATISVEICENKNILQAEENAKKLNAAFLIRYPHYNIYKHQDWSGKYCPRVILRNNRWNKFVRDIKNYAQVSKSYYQIGDRGTGVKEIQEDLIELGYSVGKYGADGSYGPSTKSAILKFQKDNKLSIDGIAGTNTRAKIEELLEKAKKKSYYNRGDKGEEIKNLQSNLIELGYNLGKYKDDGSYGPATVNAVKKFQKENKLKQDGIAGKNTLNKISVELKKKYPVYRVKVENKQIGAYREVNNIIDELKKNIKADKIEVEKIK